MSTESWELHFDVMQDMALSLGGQDLSQLEEVYGQAVTKTFLLIGGRTETMLIMHLSDLCADRSWLQCA